MERCFHATRARLPVLGVRSRNREKLSFQALRAAHPGLRNPHRLPSTPRSPAILRVPASPPAAPSCHMRAVTPSRTLNPSSPFPEAAAYSPRFVRLPNDPTPLAELGLRAPPYSADH